MTSIIPTPSVYLEDLKNKFLTAIYNEKNLDSLFEEIAEASAFSETDEKHLRQIITACKRFNTTHYEGYKQLQKRLRDRTRHTAPVYIDLQAWKAGLNLKPWQQDALLRYAITFQLTSGCSNYCRRCNEWALPRVRGHFNRDAVVNILDDLLVRDNDDLALYGGSDPLDWIDGDSDLSHILDQVDGPVKFSILTKVPKGRQALASKLVKNGIPLSVSLTSRNCARIRKLEASVGHKISKQHATSDLLIPACLDEDFDTVKPSITDSYGTEIALEGAFIIIPAFTSALYPFGHKKIPINRETQFFPVKKLGRPALLVDYFKPLEVLGCKGKCHLDGLLDVQVENILLDNGEYELTPPGMRSIKEYFEIFDDKARNQRKKMTVSVFRRLKKEYLKGNPLTNLPEAEKQAYMDKLTTHLNFTKKHKVAAARVTAAAYFLGAIKEYLSTPTFKTAIIAHLTLKEFDQISKKMHHQALPPLVNLFSDPSKDAWQLFRYLALTLVHRQPSDAVDNFISEIQARFDPTRDMFTSIGITY